MTGFELARVRWYSIPRRPRREETIYPPDQLREAVVHLRCAAQTKHTGLVAVTHVTVGDKRVLAMPVIKYAEIAGKIPRDVWELFDEKATEGATT